MTVSRRSLLRASAAAIAAPVVSRLPLVDRALAEGAAECDAGGRLGDEQAGHGLAVGGFNDLALIAGLNFLFGNDDVQEQCLGRLVAHAGQIGPDGHALAGELVALRAEPREDRPAALRARSPAAKAIRLA